MATGEQAIEKAYLAVRERYAALGGDGMSGIAVYGSDAAGIDDPTEIHLCDDKVVHVYAKDASRFQTIFESFGVLSNPNVTLVSDGAHTHHTSGTLKTMTYDLMSELGEVSASHESK